MVGWAGKAVSGEGDARGDAGGVRFGRGGRLPGARRPTRTPGWTCGASPRGGRARRSRATRPTISGAGRFHAAVVAPRLALATLARRLGRAAGLEGFVGGEALVTGTAARPEIEGRVEGRVAYAGRALGDFEARGAWRAGAARVDRLRVSGPLGAIVAGGTVRPDGTLDFRAEARGLRIERLLPGAAGIVSANLRVGGTLRDPRATGRLEGLSARLRGADPARRGVRPERRPSKARPRSLHRRARHPPAWRVRSARR